MSLDGGASSVAPIPVSFPGVGRLHADSIGPRWIPMPLVIDAYKPR